MRRTSTAFAASIVAATAAATLVAVAPAAIAAPAAPSIVSVTPAEVGLGAGQGGHAPLQIVVDVDNVATTDGVTITFPTFTGLSATVTNVNGTAHTVTANVSTSATSTVSSGFNLTLTDTTTGGSDTSPFAVKAAPKLTSASPARLLRGTTTSVTLTGTGMAAGVVPTGTGLTFGAVTVGGSGTTGTVSVTVANNAPTGPATVTLTNPDKGWSSQSGALAVDSFIVSDISPASATNATSNTSVQLTVTGTGIPAGNTTLRLTPNFSVSGQDVITASATSIAANGQQWQGNVNLANAAPGAYLVQLVNGSEIGTLTSKSFTVTAVGVPTITTVSPATLGQGADATITLTGTNFAHGAVVTFSKPAFTTTGPVVFVSSTQLQVPIHVASNAATGLANATSVTVTNTGPTPNSVVKSGALQAATGPTITSTSPTSLGQGAATTLTITGTGFQSKATVTFATGITGTGTPTITSTQIKIPVKVAADAPNKVDVTVKNPDQGAAKTTLTVNPVTFTSASPRYVSNTYTGSLTLTGSGFRSGATVSFPSGSGVAVQSGKSTVITNNGTTLTVPIVVTRTTAAGIDVTVTNTGSDLGSVKCTGCLGVAIAPQAPTGAVATKSGTTATLTWDLVTSPRDGGAPITGYTVTVTSPANSGIPAQTLAANVATATFTGLAADTDYIFAITATNAAMLTSPPAHATTSRASRLTLHANASHVVSGQSVRLFGRLLAASGSPITNAAVVIHRRSDGGHRAVVDSVTTDASGRWSIVTRPVRNQTYDASYAGDGTNHAVTSAGTRVVAAARLTIHAIANTSTETLTVYGRVAPNKAGETVRLVGVDRSGRLHHLGRVFVNARSHYRFRIALPATRLRYQVRIGVTGGNGAGRSPFLVFKG